MDKESHVRDWLAKNSFLILFCLAMTGGAVYLLWPEPRNQEDILADLEQKANYAYTVGDYAQAQALCQDLVDGSEEAYGLLHPNVATALNNLALVVQAQGKPDDALPLLQRALVINETAWGQNHRDVVKSLTNLAFLHESLGQTKEAANLHQRALEIAQSILPQDDPLISYAQENLTLVNGLLENTGG